MLEQVRLQYRRIRLDNRRHYSASSRFPSNPLRILFCGSDHFSIASLRHLDNAKRCIPGLIESIDIVHRPAKRTGRGLKNLQEVALERVAKDEFGWKTHVIDTFTGWSPPRPFDLIIAVSFGLFVPPRILSLAKYGGLNVHPSLLPDLRGPAPIQHTLLKKRLHTGVSVQTLDSEHFDKGTILAQTTPPGLQVDSDLSFTELREKLGDIGGRMLVNVLRDQAYVPPLVDAGWYARAGGPVEYAERITKQHSFVDFTITTAQDLVIMGKVLDAPPWCLLPSGDRLILNEVAVLDHAFEGKPDPGLWAQGYGGVFAKAACGRFVQIKKSTWQGGRHGTGNARVERSLGVQPYPIAATEH